MSAYDPFPGTAPKIIMYCAEECERQKCGPVSVAHMLRAWHFAVWLGLPELFTYDQIQSLGGFVEPVKNADGFRTTEALVHFRTPARAADIPRRMARFCYAIDRMTPEEAYREFEEIHPFADGNGRVGKIIFNAKLGTLLDPQMPPNFWEQHTPP